MELAFKIKTEDEIKRQVYFNADMNALQLHILHATYSTKREIFIINYKKYLNLVTDFGEFLTELANNRLMNV